MAATTVDESKVDQVVSEKSNISEVVAEKSNTIELISSDGERFEITHEAAAMSQTIYHMIEDDCVNNGVPLPNVKSNILAKVIEYCNKHAAAAAATGTSSDNNTTSGEQDLKSFDADFIKVDKPTLFELILAANYLNIKELLDLSCQTVAEMIKDYTVEQIREVFNIQNDFTPEEEAEVRAENKWAFE